MTRSTSDGTRVGVGVVVRRPDGRVLVGRRLAEPGAPPAIPGGKLDPGETIEQAAVRELEEETGIVVDADTVCVFTAVHVDGWVIPGVLAIVGDDAEPTVREPGKFGDFAWVDPGDLPEGTYAATRRVLEALP